jgi:hypothetical protein
MFTVEEEREMARYHRAKSGLLTGPGHDLMPDAERETAAERIERFVRSLGPG